MAVKAEREVALLYQSWKYFFTTNKEQKLVFQINEKIFMLACRICYIVLCLSLWAEYLEIDFTLHHAGPRWHLPKSSIQFLFWATSKICFLIPFLQLASGPSRAVWVRSGIFLISYFANLCLWLYLSWFLVFGLSFPYCTNCAFPW